MKIDHTNEVNNLFKSHKLNGCRETIYGFIDQLKFAREMRSMDRWNTTAKEAHEFCGALAAGRHITTLEARYLYDFIIRHGKGRP